MEGERENIEGNYMVFSLRKLLIWLLYIVKAYRERH